MSLAGLSQINVELSSRCDKACYFCGHQNTKINEHLEHGDMAIELLDELACQIPTGVVVQFHRDGEPLVYPELGEALHLFRDHVTSIVTNGKKLGERAAEILKNPPTSICVSMFKGDPEAEQQRYSLWRFLGTPGVERFPLVVVKVVGDELEPERVHDLARMVGVYGVQVTRRLLHVPQGSHHYRKANPTIPETGICADLLHHPAIDWKGGMYLCNRLDPEQRHFLGRIPPFTLEHLWNEGRRQKFLRAHLEGRRGEVEPCATCQFWGVPSGVA